MTQALTKIDQSTGEVIIQDREEIISREEYLPAQALSDLMNPLREGSSLFIHLLMLESNASFDVVLKDELMDLYMGPGVAFKKLGECELLVLGMIIYQHGAYKKKVGEQEEYHPEGYYQTRILVKRNDELQVIHSGSTALAMNAAYVMKRRGWWLFEEPVIFRFSIDEKGRHHMSCLASHVSERLNIHGKGEKK